MNGMARWIHHAAPERLQVSSRASIVAFKPTYFLLLTWYQGRVKEKKKKILRKEKYEGKA